MPPPHHPTGIRALVVDDEPLARTNLTHLLRLDPGIASIAECSSGADALAAIRSSRPDLVFLDVEMPECDGFDVLEMLGRDLPPATIFVTAFDQYALRAFEAGALDYLLKPFDNARFQRALDRAKAAIARGRAPSTTSFALKSAGQVTFLKVSEIDWIEAEDYYTRLHVGPKSHLLRRSLVDLEQELDPSLFCRVHRSSIVRLDRVRSLKLNAGGEYDVLLDNGATLRLSRRYRRQLQSRLGLRDPDEKSSSLVAGKTSAFPPKRVI